MLASSVEEPNVRKRREKFLLSRPRSHREGDVLYVHASPRHPLNEYVFPEDIYNQRKMERNFALVERTCFAGHTHLPGIFVEVSAEVYQYLSPEECPHGYRLDGRKVICNVGSVGQPRDGDPRACYVLFDGETIRFVRVPYDLEETVRKIHAIPELDNFLGDRLREGR
jgi:diadenosine tetraphosphatase ApaH/serine/threonine PP2A family protein phosphatase